MLPPRTYRLVLWLALSVLLSGCASLRGFDDTETDLLLEDILAGSGPSRIKSRVTPPTRDTVAYSIGGRSHHGDLYRPAAPAEAGIVLIPGVTPAGKDDRRLVALAHSLARFRFLVLVPEIPGLRRYRVRSTDVGIVADAFQYLRSRSELGVEARAGIAGFSYAAGPAILAALRDDIRQRVDFVLSVGGYHDMRRLAAFYTTGNLPSVYRRDLQLIASSWPTLAAHPQGAWIFATSNADLLRDRKDRRALHAYAAVLRAEGGSPDLYVPSPRLGPGGRALFALLDNRDPERVPALLAGLPDEIRVEIAGLNPAEHDLSRLRARLLLLHGRSDNIIPYVESMALAQAAPPGQARLFLIDGLAHVNLRPMRRDLPQLRAVATALLGQRQMREAGGDD